MTDSAPVVAAIDIGSNTIKLTVARLGQRSPEIVQSKSEVVRLSEGLAHTGQIRPDRLERAVEVLTKFATSARELGAARIEAVATEATRVAANGQLFLDRVRDTAGIEVKVISGEEEAALTARGVLAQTTTSGRVLIVDIGGASTEMIETVDGIVRRSRSISIGSGRMTDLHVAHDPPTESELETVTSAASEAVCSFFNGGVRSGKLVLVGGTGEYLIAVSGNGNPMPISALDRARERAVSLTSEQMAVVAQAPVSRARVLPAGFAIAQAIATLAKPDVIESVSNGLRIGLLLRVSDALAGID